MRNRENVPLEYKLDRSSSDRDVQRSQLNRILADIKEKLKGINPFSDYSALISSDDENVLTQGGDGKLYVPPPSGEGGGGGTPVEPGGVVDEVVAGDNVFVDNSDEERPIVSVPIIGTPIAGESVVISTSGGGLSWGEFPPHVSPDVTITAGTGLSGGGNLSQDRTISVAANGITNSLLRDSVGLSVIGRSASTTGDPGNIVASTNHQVLRRLGTSIGFGSVALNQLEATSGVLPVSRGGTGRASADSGSYLRGSGTSAMQVRTPEQVWTDIGPSARAASNTWTGQQTFNSEINGRVAGGPATSHTLVGPFQNLTLNLTSQQVFTLGVVNSGNTELTFLGAGEAKTRVIYLVCIGTAVGRELVWPSGVTVYPPSGSAPETNYAIPGGVRTVVQLLQVGTNEFYRMTG